MKYGLKISRVSTKNSTFKFHNSPKTFEAIRATVTLILLLACVGVVRASDDKKRRVELKQVTINRLDLLQRRVEATVRVEIKNPGSSFKINSVSYRLKLNGTDAAEGKYKKKINVPAASTITLDVPISVSLVALPAIAMGASPAGFKLRYELWTEFTVPVMIFFSRKVKTTITGDLPLGEKLSSLPDTTR